MMLLGLRLGSSRKVRRAACIAAMPFVFAFISFNLLDLDGSNLASFTRCFERAIIDGDVGTDARIDPHPERVECLGREGLSIPKDSRDFARFLDAALRVIARLEKARTHRYLVSLPRSSVPG
jgi:hypothetical protein